MAKRTWKTNIYGNTCGYEGGKRVEEFGCRSYAQKWAQAWCSGLSRDAAELQALGILQAYKVIKKMYRSTGDIERDKPYRTVNMTDCFEPLTMQEAEIVKGKMIKHPLWVYVVLTI